MKLRRTIQRVSVFSNHPVQQHLPNQ